MTETIQFLGLLTLMHLLGSGIFGAMIAGDIRHFLAAPIFALFGWFMVPVEALVLSLQYFVCRSHGKIRKVTLVAHTTLWATLGGGLAAVLVPKEDGRVLLFTVAAFVAGAFAALFSFYAARSLLAHRP
jgi:hypothetical protein